MKGITQFRGLMALFSHLKNIRWRAEGSRDARHTEAKMAAFREMALDTLKEEVSMEKFNGSWRFAADCSYDPPLTWDIRNKAA